MIVLQMFTVVMAPGEFGVRGNCSAIYCISMSGLSRVVGATQASSAIDRWRYVMFVPPGQIDYLSELTLKNMYNQ